MQKSCSSSFCHSGLRRAADEPPKDGAFSLPVAIGERALLFGAGHCALALAPVLKSIGFRVTVFDDRADLVLHESLGDVFSQFT